MPPQLTYSPRRPEDFREWTFETLDVDYHAASQSLWMYYKAEAPPYYSFQTLIDMADVRESLRGLFASPLIDLYPVRYFVMASRKPGVFKLGGDLNMFSDAIRAGDGETLRAYAHACIDVVHGLSSAFGLPVVTLGAIAGQALGGGLESAIGMDYVLAEETAKLGVPEVSFNTFPGMGAVSLLSRRLGSAKAEELIASGKVYSGRQMYDMGVVDILAPDAQAKETAITWMSEGGAERHARRYAIAQARRRLFPVANDELMQITDLWVECSLDVTPHDIRHMERLAAAQKRLDAAVSDPSALASG